MGVNRFNKTAKGFMVDSPRLRSLAASLLDTRSLAIARWFFLIATVLAAIALPKLFTRGLESGHLVGRYSLLWVILLSIAVLLALVELGFLILLFTPAGQKLAGLSGSLSRQLEKLGWLNGLGVCATWAVYVVVILWRYQKHFVDFAPQVWLFWLVTGTGAWFFAAWRKSSYASALLWIAVIYGAGVKVLGFLPDISDYPFSLSWSEASRYYYASLPFSRWLYGFQIPLSFLHPTRYFLQGMAFLVPGAGIGFHRFWQVALWISLSLLTGLALALRYRRGSWISWGQKSRETRVPVLAAGLWAAVFALQGPVYYHLLVCVILVLVGLDRKRFWKSLVFVGLSSAWAGISRVNWIPVPAFLAATLYLLEKPVCEDVSSRRGVNLTAWLRYLWPPLAWGAAGGIAGLASQAAYMLVSGHQTAGDFGTSFTSALLWYRLFPSPTFPLGVIPAILLVSAPLLIFIGVNWRKGRADWHPLRMLGLSAMMAVLLLGGLVVSAKIGGGSNIHNLDAYLVLLMVTGAAVGLGTFASETGGRVRIWRPWLLVLAITLLPVIWNLDVGDPFIRQDFPQANFDLDKLREVVKKYASQGEVLFITQRQLVTFHEVTGVRMAPEYELMTLMEMAIAGNQAYFDRFDQDLKNHRFALIVADRQHEGFKDSEVYSFAEENNAWVEYVSKPMLKYYREEEFFDTQGIQFLVPGK